MININQYITEKLKLNKNIKFDKNFKKGERFITLSISLRYDHKDLEIKIYEPFTIDKIDYNKVTYTAPSGKTLTHDIKLNSNDYWEIVVSDHFRGIMFKITDAIVFLRELIDNIYRLDNETLCKYFDEEDKELINNEKYTLDRRYSIKDLKEILNQIETEDYDVTEKLHLDKDLELAAPKENEFIDKLQEYIDSFKTKSNNLNLNNIWPDVWDKARPRIKNIGTINRIWVKNDRLMYTTGSGAISLNYKDLTDEQKTTIYNYMDKEINKPVTEKLHLTKDNKDNNGFFPYEKSLIKVIKDYLTGFLHYKYDEDYELKLDDNKILIHFKYNFSSDDAVYMIGEKLLEKIQQEYLHNNSIHYKNIEKSYPTSGIIQIEVNE